MVGGGGGCILVIGFAQPDQLQLYLKIFSLKALILSLLDHQDSTLVSISDRLLIVALTPLQASILAAKFVR